MIYDVYHLCPPLFALGAARLDSPVQNLADAYSTDLAFFSANPQRSVCIRKVRYGEFDPPFEIGDWLQIPQLWVEVFRVAEGFHRVTPVYRGKAFFSESLTTDAQVAATLVEMQKREGIDAEEFVAFEQRTQRKLQNTIAANSSGKVH